MEETIAAVGGLDRFGVALENLIPWPQIGVDPGMPPDLVEAINQAGELGGSKPSEWYGVFETLAIGGTVIEVWNVKEQYWKRVWTPESA
jgi:hypothetical protein